MASSDELNNSSEKLVHFVVGDGPVYSPTSSCSDESTEDDRDTDDEDDGGKIKVGVCAMAKKSRSRPMQEILERLVRFKHIETFVFDEEVILNQPVENWPICDCLISFHSKGFPLEKAVQYVEVRQPFVINDLKSQYTLQDRSKVYQILSYHGIDKPRYAVMNRDPSFEGMCQFVEADDYIEVNGATFHKPFVEKPVSAEDHNVYIYFPSSAGGGSQRLFRKIGSRSSVYSPISTVRKVGSFMYEEFMPTDGTDVKVYTVGPDYAHAEARKSPALDGKVERDKDGKEIRYPVLLSAKEKMIARTVCLAFKQNVCGFDLLRANGKSYVCDVNGFSFVKTSPKYYDDCAKILGNMILRKLAPTLHIPYSITYQAEDIPIVPTTSGTMMELRCVVAVMRHGDRTPKQKMKMEVKHKMFFSLFEKYGGLQAGHLKLKHPKQLQEVLDIARFLLYEAASHPDSDVEEKRSKLEQLKSVLEMYGHFSGINRKVQFKYQPHGSAGKSPDAETDKENQNNNKSKSKKKKKEKSSPIESCSSSSSSATSQGKGEPSLVLILKWGGELTPAGKIQAEELGKAFRCMYPGGRVSLLLIPPLAGDYGQSPGLGLLRLHSTFRHDLKIYASDEGRVQMTAAAFAKGFLALEGELTPILVQMVKSANMNGLLDNENQPLKFHNEVKEKLQEMMNADRQFSEDDFQKFVPTGSSSVLKAMQYVGNPREACVKMHDMMNKLMERVKELKDDPKAEDMRLYHGESWELMNRRWGKLIKDFLRPDGEFDISKIPDIYDCIKYDLQHNSKVLRFSDTEELHTMAKAMADIVIPQEYGMTLEEKVSIGRCICSPLLRKILADFLRNEDGDEPTRLDSRYSEGVTSPQRHVKTRLYFTSESHIHSLLTILRFGGLCDVNVDEQWSRAMDYVGSVSELNYLSQIVIMLYEDPTKAPNSDERFHVELHFSPGAYCVGQNKEYLAGRGYRPQHGEKKKQQESESIKQPVREVLTSPSQLHVIETVPEEDPFQVAVPTTEVAASSASRDSRSPVPSAGRTVSPCGNAPLPEKQRLPPLNLPSLTSQEYTCKDRSSRSTIRKTLHTTAPAHQDIEEICSSSSEMEDQSSVDAKRLKTGRIAIRKSAERSKVQPPRDPGKASSNSESGPRSSVDSHFESSSDNLSSFGHQSQEQAEKIEDLVRAEKKETTDPLAHSETLDLYLLTGRMSGLTAVNREDVPAESPSPRNIQLSSTPSDSVSDKCSGRQIPTEQLYLPNISKVVFTSTVEKITTETVETTTTETAPASLSFGHSYEGSNIISSSTAAPPVQKSVDFTPDYSLANHIVHLEKPIRSQSPCRGAEIEGTAPANAALLSKLTSSQTSSTYEGWSVGPSPVPPSPSTAPGSSTILSPTTTTANTTSSSPSVESSKYNSCSSSTANSPAKVTLVGSQAGQVIQESAEHEQAAAQSKQQNFDVDTERLSARSSNSDKMMEGGSSRRRHQSSGSIEGSSSTREKEMLLYPNNNADVCQQLQQQQQQQQPHQQQQSQQHFDFYDTPSFATQLPNLSMVETTPPTSISALASNDSFIQPSPSSTNVERSAKETRSRSLETLQKKDHHQRDHHHHHHHHHHKEHGRHKRSSFLALFNSPNSESIGQQNVLFSAQLVSGSPSVPIVADGDKVQMIDGWRVPSLRPLETLHNSLTLRQLEKFIKLVTESFNKSPDPMMSSYESYPPFPRKDVFRDDSASEKAASYCSSLEACFKPPVLPPDPPNLRAASSLSSSSSSQSPVKHSNVDEFRLDMSLNV